VATPWNHLGDPAWHRTGATPRRPVCEPPWGPPWEKSSDTAWEQTGETTVPRPWVSTWDPTWDSGADAIRVVSENGGSTNTEVCPSKFGQNGPRTWVARR